MFTCLAHKSSLILFYLVAITFVLRTHIIRLIDVNTLELKEFFSEKAPPYAILSHTWKGDTEVTFQEWQRAAVDDTIKSKEGYTKILGACRRARADGLQYLWCDTNCIDKSSSAELSEAINSMFAWYRDSIVCYAYLYNVQAGSGTFARSRWFTRGWTLQELLAPSKVLFFDQHWTVLGDRSGLARAVTNITKIHIGVLEDRSTIHDYSIAQRMSWAADRQTTRLEDIAYCLLGIFDINMPLLYGEGTKAFTRLQREIISMSNDQSILAWSMEPSCTNLQTSALAPSPTAFRFSGSIVRNDETFESAYSIKNLGISMKMALIKTAVGGVALIGLNCVKELHRKARHYKLPSGIKLKRHFRIWIAIKHLNDDTYVRIHQPSSMVFLHNSYPTLTHSTPVEIFLSLGTYQFHATQKFKDPFESLRKHVSSLPSELVLTIASGKMTLDGQIFREVYPLGGISILQLKHRGISTLSHFLISCDNLSVIFSVFWDECLFPQKWQYTTIFDPNLEVSNNMTSQEEWSCLFESYRHTQSRECCNSISAMYSIHERLREAYRKKLLSYEKDEKTPIIRAEPTVLKDLFGQPELVVDIIFRETPNSMYNSP
ncbi:HET-domain-containing protein [Daldinia caldariorum]|uniref:HET-domain-containing protein n=1 Tax=Daldinia caldariorum TaxID=326644 RepID=UPI0020075842|nr:HET-domain-containing protein [Daldinia caldariorum]KAI1469623.1 HET-domain-containing protein [Daldinia caldariorum]